MLWKIMRDAAKQTSGSCTCRNQALCVVAVYQRCCVLMGQALIQNSSSFLLREDEAPVQVVLLPGVLVISICACSVFTEFIDLLISTRNNPYPVR
jgi:hypothetical protein